VRLEQLARARISRLLHRRFVAGIEQQARTQVERLLRPADDEDLVGLADHGA
jgi:hypothetical protein